MPRIKEVNVSSKMTIKIKDAYASFETSMTADVSDMEDKVVDEYVNNTLYPRINTIIDNQIEDSIKAMN